MLYEFYPQLKDLITTNKQLTKYFLIENNRQILKQTLAETAHLLLMQQNIAHLKETQIISPKMQSNDIAWLAKNIPLDTDYLLLGEIHDVPEIHQKMAEFVPLLRKQFGQRPIIWLTEFLPELFTTDILDAELEKNVSPALLTLWHTLHAQHISIVGIEPYFVFLKSPKIWRLSQLLTAQKMSIWETLEGIRIRNEFWKNEIAKIRRRNPNALIIIHAGFGHFDYTLGNSLGTALKQKGSTFTVSWVPGYNPKHKTLLHRLLQNIEELEPVACPPDGFAPASFFDFVTRGNFPQRILKFGPQDWYITGFDVQLKVPASPQK